MKANIFGIPQGLNRYQAKSDSFAVIDENGIKFSLGRYAGFYLAEIENLDYLKRIIGRPLNISKEVKTAILTKIDLLKNNSNKEHGLYFFYNKDKNLIYIGKSESGFCRRIFSSFQERQEQTNNGIYYIKIMRPKTAADTNILEQYFIKLYKPKLNVEFNFCEDELTLKIYGLDNIPCSDFLEIDCEKISRSQLSQIELKYIMEIYNNLWRDTGESLS